MITKKNLLVMISVVLILCGCGAPTAIPTETPTIPPAPMSTGTSTPIPVLQCKGKLFDKEYSLEIGESLRYSDGNSVVAKFCSTDFSGNASERNVPQPIISSNQLREGSCYIAVAASDLSFIAFRQPDTGSEHREMRNGTYFVFYRASDAWYEVTYETNTYYLPVGTTVFAKTPCQ